MTLGGDRPRVTGRSRSRAPAGRPDQAAIGSPACCQASSPPRIAFTFVNPRPWNLAA